MTNVPLPNEVDAAIRATEAGRLFLARLNMCIRAGLFPDATRTNLLTSIGSKPAALANPLETARRELKEAVPPEALSALKDAFKIAYPDRFSLARVVTRETYVHCYTPTPEDDEPEDDEPSTSLLVSLIDRDPDLPTPSTAADLVGVSDDLPAIADSVRLAAPGGVAYVTSLEDWVRQCEGERSPANTSVKWLALPYAAATRLVLLRVSEKFDAGRLGCRRPTLLEALDSAWWICWHDDAHHQGHTFDLGAEDHVAAPRGGREWVLEAHPLDTAGDAVLPQDLGATTIDTLPRSQPMAYQKLMRLSDA